MPVVTFRRTLTKELVRKASINGKPMIVEMFECMSLDWTLELYCDYLSQFFTEYSIIKVIIPIWNSCK